MEPDKVSMTDNYTYEGRLAVNLQRVKEELEVARAEIKRLQGVADRNRETVYKANELVAMTLDKSQEYLDELARLRRLCSASGIDHRKPSPVRGLHTEFMNPTLPFRDFDWVAWLDFSKARGHGKSEKEALLDLGNRCESDLVSLINTRLDGMTPAKKQIRTTTQERCLCGGVGCNSCEPQGRG